MAPVGKLLVTNRVIIGVVAMEGQHGLSCRVVGHIDVFEAIGARGIAGNTQPTGFVVTARSTHCIYEHLIPLIKDLSALGGIGRVHIPVVAVNELVEGFEHQEIALVLELIRNLGPYRSKFFLNLRVFSGAVHSFLQVKPVAVTVVFVVMGVDDGFQACVLGISHYLSNSVKPYFVKGIIRGGANVTQPSNRDTNTGETLGL